MTMVWYQLYAFVVGRGYDRYGDSAGYYFSSYVVVPYGTRLDKPRRSPIPKEWHTWHDGHYWDRRP